MVEGIRASVVLAVHNGLRFLPAQIESVLDELGPTDEVIVIDDASSDGSADWLRGVADARLQLLRNPRNEGVLASFERGLAIARNEIVFLCDQDDVWLPGKRAAFLAKFACDPKILVVVSDAQVIDAEGFIAEPSAMAARGGFRGDICSTLWRNRYSGCFMAVRRKLLDAALPIPRRVPMHDMWLGVLGAALGKVCYLPTPLLQYRRHGANLSPSHRQGWIRMLRWRLALLIALAIRRTALALGWHTR